MNRKQFIESQGATCDNWTWSWSFINKTEKFIIFGAWDKFDSGDEVRIFSKEWETSRRGNGSPGYRQSREHIRLIEEEGYQLKTFPMKYTVADENDEGAPAKIKEFTPELSPKELIRRGDDWFASYWTRLPEEIYPDEVEVFREGASKTVTVNQFERSAAARSKCLEHHGYKCAVCSFDFENTYGEIGKGYIHVHHIVPISEIEGEYDLDPVKDLIPVCPNCHAMIHSVRPALSIEQLRNYMKDNGNQGSS